MTKTGIFAAYNINYRGIPSIAKRFWLAILNQKITKYQNWEILKMPDHIHLFVTCDPLVSHTIVKMFKENHS